MPDITTPTGAGKGNPRPNFNESDAKRFCPINADYLRAIDSSQQRFLREASARLTDYADVFARLYLVFRDVIDTELHDDGQLGTWTEYISMAAEKVGSSAEHMGGAIGCAAQMTGLPGLENTLRKLARLPRLTLTHRQDSEMTIDLTDGQIIDRQEHAHFNRELVNAANLKAFLDRYDRMLALFHIFFSEMVDIAEDADTLFYNTDVVAAEHIWQIAWTLEKRLNGYRSSIASDIGSLTAKETPTPKRSTRKGGGQ